MVPDKWQGFLKWYLAGDYCGLELSRKVLHKRKTINKRKNSSKLQKKKKVSTLIIREWGDIINFANLYVKAKRFVASKFM